MMQQQQFGGLVEQGAVALGVVVEPSRIDLLYRYFVELKRWSAKVNLVARTEHDEELVEKHFVDSLAVPALLGGRPGGLLDVGSGAGFPGLVCKIIEPERYVTLLEPRLKRVSFLRHVIRSLGLDGIDVLDARLDGESCPVPECRWIVGRAVADIDGFLALCGGYRLPGCRVICMKGPRYEEELRALHDSGQRWVVAEEKQYCLPQSGSRRVLLVFRSGEADHLMMEQA